MDYKPEYSIFFIKFYGYFMFLFAGALLLSKEGRKMMIKTSQDEAQVILTGMISLLIGLPVIILHNVWTADIVGFITFVGWMSVLKGVVRIAYPSHVVNMMRNYTGKSVNIWLIVAVGLGVGLIYCGYYPYWC
jgi:hypothetical protein